MNKFDLVNPCIIGQMNTTYTAENSMNAVTQFWNDLSPHITNNMPRLIVTLKDSKNKLFHYEIKEKVHNGKLANYTIKEFAADVSLKDKNMFLKKVKQVKESKNTQIQNQLGGKDKKYNIKAPASKSDSSSDSSSDSDSDSDTNSDDYYDFRRYKRMSQPIVYWWYTPYLYKVNTLYTPTFNIPLTPYINTWIPTNLLN